MKNFRTWWINYKKKRYIRRFIKKEVRTWNKTNGLPLKHSGNDNVMNVINTKNDRIKTLTDSIFKASQIVESEVNTKKRWKERYENDTYLKELKKFIDKHYGGEIKSLKRENDKLIADLDESNTKLKEIKKINVMNMSTING